MEENNGINLNLLRYFVVSAESESFAEAGEKLGYSASTISTSISALEGQLGVKLFTRKPLKLTEIGKEIYKTVKNGFADLDFVMVLAQSRNNLENGNISIGCPSHITDFYLMERIANAVRDYPNLKIKLDDESNGEQLLELLKDNKIDFAILDLLPDINLDEFEIKPLTETNYIFVSKQKIVLNDIKDLKKYKYILAGENKKSTKNLFSILKKYNVNIKTILDCPSTEQRVNAAKMGIGVAYVMKEAVKKELKEKELYEIEVPIELPKSTLNIVYLKEHLTKVDKKFINNYLK